MPRLVVRGWGGRANAAPSPTGTPTDLLAAIAGVLSGSGLLAGLSVGLTLVDGRIQLPFVVFDLIDSVPQTSNSAVRYWEWVTVQYTVHAATDDDAYRWGTAAAGVMGRASATPRLVFADGYEMGRYPGRRHGPREVPGTGRGGLLMWAYVFEYRYQIGRTY